MGLDRWSEMLPMLPGRLVGLKKRHRANAPADDDPHPLRVPAHWGL